MPAACFRDKRKRSIDTGSGERSVIGEDNCFECPVPEPLLLTHAYLPSELSKGLHGLAARSLIPEPRLFYRNNRQH
jgi:hypothetical protein